MKLIKIIEKRYLQCGEVELKQYLEELRYSGCRIVNYTFVEESNDDINCIIEIEKIYE